MKKIEEENPDLNSQEIQQKRKEVNLFLLLKTMELSLKGLQKTLQVMPAMVTVYKW